MRNVLISVAVGIVAVASAGGLAHAGAPAQHACLGQSVSADTQTIHPFGAFVSSVARDTVNSARPGVGDDVQQVKSGQVPDSVFPNTCNSD